MEKNKRNFWDYEAEDHFFTKGGILIDVEKNHWEFVDFEEALKLEKEIFSEYIFVLEERQLVNHNINYGEFDIEEGADYLNTYNCSPPENIAILEAKSNSELILNYADEYNLDWDKPFRTAKIFGKCLIMGIYSDGGEYGALPFSTMQAIIKGCLALDETELKQKQEFIKNKVEEYLSEFD